ncbi:hypothetical protein [Haloechinothrix salitolerans]|uniref:Uncharacterized protein n=1 Tax=Haloechinothrix salitolerans TaxID=926830 RepID=A0ABW2BTL4_9PSEU
MATAEQRNHAKAFLKKTEEYLASAEDNLAAGRNTPAAGDAIHAGIHAGISAKDAIVTALTGATSEGKDHPQRRRNSRPPWPSAIKQPPPRGIARALRSQKRRRIRRRTHHRGQGRDSCPTSPVTEAVARSVARKPGYSE